MLLLPRGTPVKENLDPGRLNLPDALRKLAKGTFTGYLRFDTTKGVGILIYEQGKLISALFEGGTERLIAYDALSAVCELSLGGNVTLNIYRLSDELAISVHALLHGAVLYKGQEVALLDIKGLLTKLKTDEVTGCLRIYNRDHVALIFYREGTPLGFFHDGSTEMEKSAENSLSVAKLPGAKIDVLTTEASDEANLADLLASADIDALWKTSRSRIGQEQQAREEEISRNLEVREKERRQKVLAMLRGVAEKQLGRIGGNLTEKEFEKAMFGQGLVSEAVLNDFYKRIAKAARLVAGPATVNKMVEEMQRGIKNLMKTP